MAYFTKDFLKFIKDLGKNNNRDWFNANKSRYIQYVNPKFSAITGYPSGEAVGQKAGFLKSDQTPSELYEELRECLEAGREWHGVFVNRRKDGEIYKSEQSICPIRNPQGQITTTFQ